MVHADELRAQFTKRLKEAIADYGIAEWGAGVRLAEIAGVTPKAASKWLNQESTPGPAKMLALCAVLGVRREWLEYGEGEKRPGTRYTVQVKEDTAGQAVQKQAENLFGLATPRSRTALERIASAAEAGRITEEDLLLLERIAERFERDGQQAEPGSGSNTRLRERLRNDDSNPKQ